MLPKVPIGKGRAYDIFHKGGVLICLAITVLAMTDVSVKFGNIFWLKYQHKLNKNAAQQEELQDAAGVLTTGEDVQKL